MPSPRMSRAKTRNKKFGASADAIAPIDHDGGDRRVHALRPKMSAMRPKTNAPTEGTEDCCTGHPTRLGRREVPLDLDQCGDRADDEEVVGVGEESHPRDQDRPMMETARRRIVEQLTHATGAYRVERRRRRALA